MYMGFDRTFCNFFCFTDFAVQLNKGNYVNFTQFSDQNTIQRQYFQSKIRVNRVKSYVEDDQIKHDYNGNKL